MILSPQWGEPIVWRSAKAKNEVQEEGAERPKLQPEGMRKRKRKRRMKKKMKRKMKVMKMKRKMQRQ